MVVGVKTLDTKKNVDERGLFAEVVRQDWKDLLVNDSMVQANLS